MVSFEHAGVLTNNAGIVVTLEDDSEFQCTIVQSERARSHDETWAHRALSKLGDIRNPTPAHFARKAAHRTTNKIMPITVVATTTFTQRSRC